MDLTGLSARVVQHENDHLDGVMFTDRVSQAALRDLQPLLDDLALQLKRHQSEGTIGPDDELITELQRLERERTTV